MRRLLVLTVVGLIVCPAVKGQTTQSAPAAKDNELKARVVRVTLLRSQLREDDADEDTLELLERENPPETARLTILLVVPGKAAVGATGWGQAELEARDDRGTSLDLQPWSRWGRAQNPEATFVSFETTAMSIDGRKLNAPPLVPLTFEVPGREARKVSVHGEFKLRVPERVEIDIPDLAGKPRWVDDKRLKELKVGVQLLGVTKPGDPPPAPADEDEEDDDAPAARDRIGISRSERVSDMTATGEQAVHFVLTSEMERVLSADLVDADGGLLDSAGTSVTYRNRRLTYELRARSLPEDAKLRLVLVRQWREPVVRIDFKDIELP